jgi:hypothetical protein
MSGLEVGGIVARNALSLLGVTSQKRIVPTPLHALFTYLVESVLPESLMGSIHLPAGLEEQQRMDRQKRTKE